MNRKMTLIIQWVLECYTREFNEVWLSGAEIVHALNAVGVNMITQKIAAYLDYLSSVGQQSILEKKTLSRPRKSDFMIVRFDDERLNPSLFGGEQQRNRLYDPEAQDPWFHNEFTTYHNIEHNELDIELSDQIEYHVYRLNKLYRSQRYQVKAAQRGVNDWAIYDTLKRHNVAFSESENIANEACLKFNQSETVQVLETMIKTSMHDSYDIYDQIVNDDQETLFMKASNPRKAVDFWEWSTNV